jgi:hypothetical protein
MNLEHHHNFNQIKIPKPSLLETINHRFTQESSAPNFLASEMANWVSRLIAYRRLNHKLLIHLNFIHFRQLNLAIRWDKR